MHSSKKRNRQAEERHARWHDRSMNKGLQQQPPTYKLKPPTPIQLSASDQSDQEQESDQESVHSSTKTKKNRPNVARISLNAVNLLYAPDMQLSNMAQELGEDMMRNLDRGAPENLGDNPRWDRANIKRAKHGGTRRKRNRNNASKRLRKRKHHGKTLRRK